MKAALVQKFDALDDLAVVEVNDPSPKRGEILIDVVAADVTHPDLLVVEGKYQNKLPLPFSPGKAAGGRVISVGDGVTEFSVGDRVMAQVEFGAHAEKLCAVQEHCVKVPDGISFQDVAALGLAYQTAWFGLKDRASMQEGEVVLVLGASGSVGMATVQLAKALGASVVIAATRGMGNAEQLHAMGADHVLDLTIANLQDELRAQVGRCSNGHGADIVIDPVGGDAHAAAMRSLAWRGRLVVVGFTSGTVPTIRANYLLVKNIAVSGLQWFDYRERRPQDVRDAQSAIFSLLKQGKIKPPIKYEFDLDHAKDALILLRDGNVGGHIIIHMPD